VNRLSVSPNHYGVPQLQDWDPTRQVVAGERIIESDGKFLLLVPARDETVGVPDTTVIAVQPTGTHGVFPTNANPLSRSDRGCNGPRVNHASRSTGACSAYCGALPPMWSHGALESTKMCISISTPGSPSMHPRVRP